MEIVSQLPAISWAISLKRKREREGKKKKKLAFLIWSKSGMQRSLKVTHKNGNSCWGHFAEGMEDPQ